MSKDPVATRIVEYLAGVVETTDGNLPQGDGLGVSNPETDERVQHKSYWVLSETERAKGFVRPVRQAYVHRRCGAVTKMGRALSETYARRPDFYGSTYCATCYAHFPVGAGGEFLWDGTNDKVGT